MASYSTLPGDILVLLLEGTREAAQVASLSVSCSRATLTQVPSLCHAAAPGDFTVGEGKVGDGSRPWLKQRKAAFCLGTE